MSFQIITDSCCDFTAEQYRQMDVVSVPLAVMWNGESHSHFSDEESLRDFYEQMRQGLTATTSALNPADWAAAMEPFLREGRDLLILAKKEKRVFTQDETAPRGPQYYQREKNRK